MTSSQRYRRRRPGRGRPRNKALLALVVVLIVVVGAGAGAAGYALSIANSAPPLSSLKPRDPGATSRVFASDGKTPLGFIQADELRENVERKRIPKVVRDATVAIEDERFYKHEGVDYEGVARAVIKNLKSDEKLQGGSTITMQLIRTLYITRERTYRRKLREAKLALELEEKHSKGWILDKYLNTIPYGTVGGQTAIGIQAASRMYFNKPAWKLSLREAALLAGLPQAPSSYSPFKEPERAEARRNEVLDKMAEQGMITRETAELTKRKSLGVKQSKYFTRRRESYFFDYVKDELIKVYGAKAVRQGGMKIYTTIDLKKQQEARKAMTGQLGGVGPSSAIVTIDPKNGYIRAMASTADYVKSKFNLAAQGHRQPGSAFKIMALMAAVRNGVDPDRTSYTSRSPTVLSNTPWGPIDVKTYGGKGAGRLTLSKATLKSDNSVYIQLALDIGPQNVKQAARDMGIKSKLNGYPAETLGGLERGVSPLEMANAYATIAAGGIRHRPTAVKRVEFPDGDSETPKRFRVKGKRAFPDWVTAKVSQLLQQNIKSGTGGKAEIGCPAGGKTGTTDKNSDAWFVGFTPRLATAVWVGYPNDRIYMNSEYHGGPVDGGTYPAEIWGRYMKAAVGGFCSGFRPAKSSPQYSAFRGKYSQRGGSEDEEGQDPAAPAAPTTPSPQEYGDEESERPKRDKGEDNGGGRRRGAQNGEGNAQGGGREFDPRMYEDEPQGEPRAQDGRD